MTATSIGFVGRPTARQAFPCLLAFTTALAAAIAASTVGVSATAGSTYGSSHHVGLALALAELIVRYPISVLTEEAMFRGWMQPRLGPNGPVIAALLWGAYHLQQVSTIPSLVLFGILFGLVRWWLGNVRLTGIVHLASNALFFITTDL